MPKSGEAEEPREPEKVVRRNPIGYKEGTGYDVAKQHGNTGPRSILTAIKSTVVDILGGHEVITITQSESDAFPQLHVSNEHQYSWIQFMVWRKWLCFAAIMVSLAIAGLTFSSTKTKFDKLWDAINRCDEGSQLLINYENNQGKTVYPEPVSRTAVMDILIKPLKKPYGVKRYACKEVKRVNKTTGKIIKTDDFFFKKGEKLDCNDPLPTSSGSWMLDNQSVYPAYFPHIVNKDGEEYESDEISGDHVQFHNIPGSNEPEAVYPAKCDWFPFAPWMKNLPGAPVQKTKKAPDGAGMGVEAPEFLKQTKDAGCNSANEQHMQPQACLCGLPISVFQSYDFLNISTPEWHFAAKAETRNMLQFKDASFCQAPKYSWKQKCTIDKVCTDIGFRGNIWGANVTNVHKQKCQAIVNGKTFNGTLSNFLPRKYSFCYYSEKAEMFIGKDYKDRFPKAQTRRCCSTQEFITTKAMWNNAKKLHIYFQLACEIAIVLCNIFCAVMGYCYWTNWKVSRKYIFAAWMFPFLVKFVSYSIPSFETQGVKPPNVAELTMDYTMNQIGWENFLQLQKLSKSLITDSTRQALISVGLVDSVFNGEECSNDYTDYQDTDDTFDGGLEAHIDSKFPEMSELKKEYISEIEGSSSGSEDYYYDDDYDAYYDDEAYEVVYPNDSDGNGYGDGYGDGDGDGDDNDAYYDEGSTNYTYAEVVYRIHKLGGKYWNKTALKLGDEAPNEKLKNAGCAAMMKIAADVCENEEREETDEDCSIGAAICEEDKFKEQCPKSCIPADIAVQKKKLPKAMQENVLVKDYVMYQTSTWAQLEPCFTDGLCTVPQFEMLEDLDLYQRVRKRLISCDFKGATKWIELQSRKHTNSKYVTGTQLRNISALEEQELDLSTLLNISALGTCDMTTPGAEDSERSKENSCYQMYQYGLTVPTDMQIPSALEQAEVVLKDTYDRVLQQASDAVNYGFRVKEAGKSLIGLLPITLAVLPGLAKGAKKVKYIVPQATLVGFLLFAIPVLQLPTMAAVFCMLIQVAGTWYVWLAIMCFVAACLCPILGLQNGFGSHRDRGTYRRSKKWLVCGMQIAQEFLQGPLMLLSAAFIIINFSEDADQIEMMGLDDLKGQASAKSVTAITALFNFFKGKTFTVLMSADLLMQTMIFLEGYTLIQPELMSVYKKRMVGGLLLSVEQKDIDYISQFDKDGDGKYDDSEIRQMMQHIYQHKVERMKKIEEKEDAVLMKKEMRKSLKIEKKSKRAVAPAPEDDGTPPQPES